MLKRTSKAKWEGDLKSGKGTIHMGKNGLEFAYSFQSRFENGQGTNPEELAAAAHAGCYSMALSHALASAGHTPKSVATTANVELDKVEGGFHIPRIQLDCEAEVPGIDDAGFQKIAADAKANCPISKLFAGAEIVLNASLKG